MVSPTIAIFSQRSSSYPLTTYSASAFDALALVLVLSVQLHHSQAFVGVILAPALVFRACWHRTQAFVGVVLLLDLLPTSLHFSRESAGVVLVLVLACQASVYWTRAVFVVVLASASVLCLHLRPSQVVVAEALALAFAFGVCLRRIAAFVVSARAFGLLQRGLWGLLSADLVDVHSLLFQSRPC